MWEDVEALRTELRHLKSTNKRLQNTRNKFCSLYMRVAEMGHDNHIGKSKLESLLECSVSQYVRLVDFPFPSFKVRISECDVQSAMAAGAKSGCFVAPWGDRRGNVCGSSGTPLSTLPGTKTKKKSKTGVKMSCWNCRGLSSSLPYLNTQLDPEEGSKIVVLSEHWLWPYDLHKLNDVNEEYDAVGKSDCRLNEDREGGRGCGGIGILWHKSISACPISGISSDRICGIRFSLDDGDNSVMSVIGVYLPCLDQGVDCYRDQLVELERVISDSQLLGPVVVLGDFNAHLGGAESNGEQNLQGVLLQEVLQQCDLSAVSQGALASGPGYTFYSGDTRTTVDYILMDVDAASMMVSCCTHRMDDLNTSDHLPLSVSLSYDVCQSTQGRSPSRMKIDWVEARKSGALDVFTDEVQTRLRPLFTGVYDSAEMISSEIERVAGILTEAAEELLPSVQPRKKSRFRDDTLSRLCAQSRAARAAWRAAGSPSEGPLSEEKNRLRRAVRKRVRWCAARSERVRSQRRDKLFAARDSQRFRTPHTRKSRCSKLVVGEETVQDPELLLKVWAEYFQKLGESRLGDTPDACERKTKVHGISGDAVLRE